MDVTLQDIADELNVSVMTVSRSLRQDPTTNPETRARVNEAARRLGYKGSNGRRGRPRRSVEQSTSTRVVGLLTRFSSLSEVQKDFNLMKMMAGIMSVTDEHGMHVKVHSMPAQEQRRLDEEPSLLPPMIQEGTCQALIAHGAHDERDLAFLSHRVPVVSMGRIYRTVPIDAVVADNIQGIHRLVTHLVELGHRRLAWVGAYYTSSFMEAREGGFLQGCRAHKLELGPHSFFGPEIYQKPEIHDKDALLAAMDAGVTAFVCGNNGIAVKVIRVLEEAGRRVPEDASVTGFDGPLDPHFARQLTSIDPHFFEIGEAAARLALQRLAHPPSQPYILSVWGELVLGETTAPRPDVSSESR